MGDESATWRALDQAEATAQRVVSEETPLWPWVFPFDTGKIARYRLTCAVRLRRPDIVYSVVEDLSLVTSGHRKQSALVLLDLAGAHAARTASEWVLNQALQFRRTVPARASRGLLRDFDERVRAVTTQPWALR